MNANRILLFDKLAIGLGAAALLAAGIFVYAYGTSTQPARAAAAGAPAARIVHVNAAIVTDAQTGMAGDIAYVPSNFQVPADATVVFRITNFDGATALPAPYASVRGTVGNEAYAYPIKAKNPNASGTPRPFTSLNAKTGVAHTFSIPALGINVPIPAYSVVTFTIHTGKAGTYSWRCFDPCGTGPSGWGAAMSRVGYMEGTFTVVSA